MSAKRAYYCMECPEIFPNAESANAHHAATRHNQTWRPTMAFRPPLGDTPADALLMIDNFPRRNRVDLWTRAEKAIQDAVDVCETTLPADPLETYSIILLAEARAKVAQLVDREIRAGRMAMPTGPTSTPVSEGTPDLKPCPFCGEDAAEETIIDKNEGVAYTPWYQAVCRKCDFWLMRDIELPATPTESKPHG